MALKHWCKECGTELPAGGRATSARAASARSRSPTTTPGSTPARRGGRSRPARAGIWRYADFLPFAGRPGDPLEPGLTPLVRADRLAERLGLGEVWVKNDAANPTHSFKDRVVAVALAKAQRAGLRDRRLRLDRQPRQRRRRPCRRRRPRLLRLRARRPRGAEAARDRRLRHALVGVHGNYDDVNRLCTELCETRPWAFVNVNLRPYYAEGSKTLAYETVEQLGWQLPDRIVCPIASGSLFTKIGRGFAEWLELGLVEGELPAFNGAQARGLRPRWPTAFAEGWDVCKPQRPRHDRQEPRDRRPRRRPLRARAGAHEPAARSTR